jgi:hypothetical protein
VTSSLTYRFMGGEETSAWWLEWYGKVEALVLVRRPDLWNVTDWLLRKVTGGAARLAA